MNKLIAISIKGHGKDAVATGYTMSGKTRRKVWTVPLGDLQRDARADAMNAAEQLRAEAVQS